MRGTAKTEARDAIMIADAARTLPHTLRRVDAGDDILVELEMLVSYDDDLLSYLEPCPYRCPGLPRQPCGARSAWRRLTERSRSLLSQLAHESRLHSHMSIPTMYPVVQSCVRHQVHSASRRRCSCASRPQGANGYG